MGIDAKRGEKKGNFGDNGQNISILLMLILWMTEFLINCLNYSKVSSNVPAALILAKLTTQWKALLWGVSVGGYGNLMGSLANIIAYRLYVRQNTSPDHNRFLLLFTGFGYLFFILGIGLYFLCQGL